MSKETYPKRTPIKQTRTPPWPQEKKIDHCFQYNLESLHSTDASSQCKLQAEQRRRHINILLSLYHICHQNE